MKEYKIRLNPETEHWRSARILADRFIQRWDLHAVQLDDGRYICVREPLHGRQVVRHLKGDVTLGAYVLNEESKASYTVLDADDDVAYHRLFKLADELAADGVPSYMEASRRGGHLWFFFDEPVAGEKAKAFGEQVLAEHMIDDGVEVFPKQGKLKSGPGSLIRLPFGVHRKSGKIYPFVNREDGMPMAGDIHEQILNLRRPKTVGKDAVDWYVGLAPPTEKAPKTGRPDNIWERIRAARPAMDFIGRYIELTPTDTGGVGYCPLHEDKVKSFGVHREGNYWRCFAGCGGGSIIDFWMKWKKLEFGEAVHELKEMLEVE